MAQVNYLIGQPVFDPAHAFREAIFGDVSPPTSTQFTIEFLDYKVVFKGSFTVAGGDVTAGTVTGFDVFVGATKVTVAKEMAIDGALLFDALSTNDYFSVNDLVFDSGQIKFIGSSRDDSWEGREYSDKLLGKAGNDHLVGREGDDVIKGGKGSDRLEGDEGFDKLWGNAGHDVFAFFIYSDPSPGFDQIKDFKVGEDLISLLDFPDVLREGYLEKSNFHKGTAAVTADQHVIYDKKSGKIYFDVDGSGALDQHLFAKVKAGTKLSADDFFIDHLTFV